MSNGWEQYWSLREDHKWNRMDFSILFFELATDLITLVRRAVLLSATDESYSSYAASPPVVVLAPAPSLNPPQSLAPTPPLR